MLRRLPQIRTDRTVMGADRAWVVGEFTSTKALDFGGGAYLDIDPGNEFLFTFLVEIPHPEHGYLPQSVKRQFRLKRPEMIRAAKMLFRKKPTRSEVTEAKTVLIDGLALLVRRETAIFTGLQPLFLELRNKLGALAAHELGASFGGPKPSAAEMIEAFRAPMKFVRPLVPEFERQFQFLDDLFLLALP